jgi:hypothetical protein
LDEEEIRKLYDEKIIVRDPLIAGSATASTRRKDAE